MIRMLSPTFELNFFVHAFRPDLLDYRSCRSRTSRQNLEQAFNIAERDLGVTKLLDPEDVDCSTPDEKSLITYISSLYELFPEPPENNPLLDNEKISQIEQYKKLANYLVEWMDSSVNRLNDRNFPPTLEEMKRVQAETHRFRSEEVPPRHSDKELLVKSYQEIFKMAMTLPIRIEDDIKVESIEKKWTKVMQAYQKRDRDIKSYMSSLEDLEQVAEKLRKNIKECNRRLNEIEIDILAIHKQIQTQEPNKFAIDKIQNELQLEDERIQSMFNDARFLCEKQYPQGKDLHDQVTSLHKRYSNICLEFSTKVLDAIENQIFQRVKAVDDFISALHKKLIEKEKLITKKFYDPIPRNLDDLANLVIEHKEFEFETKKYEVDVEKVKVDFENLPTKNAALKNKLDALLETWAKIWNCYNKYVDLLKSVEVVLKDVCDASRLVGDHEIRLSKAPDMSADLEQTRIMFEEYKHKHSELQNHSKSFEKLLSNVSAVRNKVARNRIQQKNHPDLDRLEEDCKCLHKRWNNILNQIFERYSIG